MFFINNINERLTIKSQAKKGKRCRNEQDGKNGIRNKAYETLNKKADNNRVMQAKCKIAWIFQEQISSEQVF